MQSAEVSKILRKNDLVVFSYGGRKIGIVCECSDEMALIVHLYHSKKDRY